MTANRKETEGAGSGPPTPIETSQKKDGHRAAPRCMFRELSPPPLLGQISGSATAEGVFHK